MGDVRFEGPFQRVKTAGDRAATLRGLSDDDVIGALAAARDDPLLANVLATEASNRIRRATTISNVIDDGVLVASADGLVRYGNPAAGRILGVRQAALIDRPLHDMLHSAGHACGGAAACAVARALTRPTGDPGTPHTIWTRDSDAREISVAVYPILRDGTIDGRVVTIRDTTELALAGKLVEQRLQVMESAMGRSLEEIEQRKRVEADLRESERRMGEIVNTIGEGVIMLDPDGRVTFYNRALEEIMGNASERVIGQNFRETATWALLARDGVTDRLNALFESVVTRGEAVRDLEVELPRADGALRVLLIDIVPMRTVTGDPSGVLGSVADITARKRAEQDLVDLNRVLETRVAERTRALERVNNDLETFMRAASHDLKAPLRGIDALARALEEDQRDGLDEEGIDIVHRLQREATRATRLVDNLLSLSRVEREELHPERVDLSALAGDVIERHREWEPERRVDVEIQPGLAVEADAVLVEIVIANLLGNAWKYTARRSDAAIAFGRLEGTDDVYFVKDNGIGFDVAKAVHLFEPFRRLPSARGFEGTGLGLATVKRIVGKHGGRIWAEAEPGVGATFYFTLRKASSPPTVPATVS